MVQPLSFQCFVAAYSRLRINNNEMIIHIQYSTFVYVMYGVWYSQFIRIFYKIRISIINLNSRLFFSVSDHSHLIPCRIFSNKIVCLFTAKFNFIRFMLRIPFVTHTNTCVSVFVFYTFSILLIGFASLMVNSIEELIKQILCG